jgi:hypothetical protein
MSDLILDVPDQAVCISRQTIILCKELLMNSRKSNVYPKIRLNDAVV